MTIPYDYFDGYRGVYGIEDTRQTLVEAKPQGIPILHPHRQRRPRLFTAYVWRDDYVVLDEVKKLPLQVADA